MNIRRFLMGAGVGALVGIALHFNSKRGGIPPEKALKIVKQHIRNKGMIQGSWIHMIPEKFKKNTTDSPVYRGGLTCMIENEVRQYDFLVHAETGEILTLSKI
ncbi:MAG: PepSY domain-containing protein [Bacillaceae bacterium]|nr:PepSY domain-containing protein [Bacillaceae bacterium]